MNSLVPLPKTMRAVFAQDGRGGIDVTTVPVPQPGKGEVLVRMAAAPVNPSDLAVLSNWTGRERKYPLPAGREGSGTVVASGGGPLANWLVGKRVAAISTEGAWADYLQVPATQCLPLPKRITFEQGSMAFINPLSAVVLLDIAKSEGHRAVVNTAAASQLGRMIHRLFEKDGVAVIHIVRREAQADLLRNLGVKTVLVSASADFDRALKEKAHDLEATLFLDAIGGAMTGRLVDAAPDGSTILIYSLLSGESFSLHPRRLMNDRIRIEGFFLGTWFRHAPKLKVLRFSRKAMSLLDGDLQSAIAHKFLLTETAIAVEHARSHATEGKAILVIDPEAVDLRP